MNWFLPRVVNHQNYEYAKICLATAKRSIVCGETMKSKPIEHEQYCKKFHKKENSSMDNIHYKEMETLEHMIREYEIMMDI